MKTSSVVIWASIGLACLCAVAALAIPIPATWTEGSAIFYWSLATSFGYTPLYLGASLLFIIGVAAYKARLRLAYSGIVLSVLLIALGLLQLPILNAYDLTDSLWVESGGVVLPFVVSGLAAYMGVRLMARQVGVRSIWTRFSVALPTVIIAVAASTVLPHAPSTTPEIYVDLSNAVVMWDVAIFAICTVIALRIKRQIGAHYTNAMAWLALGFFGSTIVTTTELVESLVGWTSLDYAIDILMVAIGLLYLKAGRSFALTKEV